MPLTQPHLAPLPAACVAYAVRRLGLSDFRCYATLRIEVDARPVVLTGPNGAGKTNLLEALSLLVAGRGLRGASLAELGRRRSLAAAEEDAPRSWAVAARVDAPGGSVDIGTGVADAAPRRSVRIDGATAGTAALGAHLRALWLTPEMDRLFLDGAPARRRFVDRLVLGFDPAHTPRLQAYDHALRERARLLRDARIHGRAADSAWLAVLEETMAEGGIAIAAARAALVHRLNAAADSTAGPTANRQDRFPRARLALDGEVDSWLAAAPALAVEDRLRARLAELRAIDAETGGAGAGPHRSDLAAVHAGTGMPAALCSTGEQKALLVGIVLGAARLQARDHGAAPLLLLDEVAAHLDESRRAALFDEIAALGAQAWMTGTDRATFAPLAGRAQLLGVVNADVRYRNHPG